MRNYSTPPRNNQPPTSNNSHNSQEIDWDKLSPKIIEDAARRLMSHRPNRWISGSLRFGNNDSFTVDPADGVFYDHEEEVGGGVFQMVKYILKCDNLQAFRWLSDNGYIDNTFTPSAQTSIPHNRRQRNRSSNTGDWDGFEAGLKLWQESESISYRQSHPVRRWCLHRNLFPGYKELPTAIRWHGAKGCIIVALAPIKDFIDAYPDSPEPRQFHLMAIDKHGQKRGAFSGDDKRTWGKPGVTCVAMFLSPNTDEIYIAEGVADALGIYGKHPDTPVIATIGSLSKVANCQQSKDYLSDGDKRAVTIFPDNDGPGLKGRDTLMEAIGGSGGDVYYVENWRDMDPADAAAGGIQ